MNRGRYKVEHTGRPGGNEKWNALGDGRPLCATVRQMFARQTADWMKEETSIQAVLEHFWRFAKCPRCLRFGPCEHRDRRADLAEIMAEKTLQS